MTTTSFHPSVTSSAPKYGVYVVCPAPRDSEDQNFGRWIDFSLTPKKADVEKAITTILKNSPDPNATEFDFEGITGLPDFCGGWPCFELILEFITTLTDFRSELDRQAYFSLCQHEDRIFTETQFRGRFQGVYASTAEFAQEYFEEKNISDGATYQLYQYIDWQKVWDGQMACTGAYGINHERGILIFW